MDYSPINSLIQSPANIIPDINNTLQFLSGKALYTSLDLKQAYLSLKVDEQSRVLSTFLTPTGSYQWTSVPTGMANSPAYWADASEKMIHSEPVLDKEGKPIYECKGVVKLKKSPLPFVKRYFDDILTTSLLRETFHETLILHFQILEQLIKRLAFHGSKISIQKSD
ncbi:MAG: reverse transcriptase domain-containing protein, partial [bacterium]